MEVLISYPRVSFIARMLESLTTDNGGHQSSGRSTDLARWSACALFGLISFEEVQSAYLYAHWAMVGTHHFILNERI